MKTIIQILAKLHDAKKACVLQRYFMTKKREYGAGDIFLGITVPKQRIVAKKYYRNVTLKEIEKLLKSKVHEHRFTALEMLVMKFSSSNQARKKEIVQFYLQHTKGVNNWDLVDTSAAQILGTWLLDKHKSIAILYKLAKSHIIWERRIAIVSTFSLIKQNQFVHTLGISRILLKDKHDFIHKALGWMLREVGRKDEKVLRKFLDANATKMPRTSLRYAIERFSPTIRAHYRNLT